MKLFYRILELLYPRKCVLCTRLLTRAETDLCHGCRSETERIEGAIERGRFFQSCHSVYYYEGNPAQAVLRMKFGGHKSYASCFGRLIAQGLVSKREDFDLITWAPVSKKRLRKRGFDQAQCIAEAVAAELRCPCVRALKKIRNNPPQSKRRDRAARLANVLNVYAVVQPQRLKGKRLLLIDDVITSGATLSECSRILRLAGAQSVSCATFAATREQ